jgi:hypothetical protein
MGLAARPALNRLCIPISTTCACANREGTTSSDPRPGVCPTLSGTPLTGVTQVTVACLLRDSNPPLKGFNRASSLEHLAGVMFRPGDNTPRADEASRSVINRVLRAGTRDTGGIRTHTPEGPDLQSGEPAVAQQCHEQEP